MSKLQESQLLAELHELGQDAFLRFCIVRAFSDDSHGWAFPLMPPISV